MLWSVQYKNSNSIDCQCAWSLNPEWGICLSPEPALATTAGPWVWGEIYPAVQHVLNTCRWRWRILGGEFCGQMCRMLLPVLGEDRMTSAWLWSGLQHKTVVDQGSWVRSMSPVENKICQALERDGFPILDFLIWLLIKWASIRLQGSDLTPGHSSQHGWHSQKRQNTLYSMEDFSIWYLDEVFEM